MTTKVKHGVIEYNSGQVIQSEYAELTALTSTANTFPDDDTIPQNTEGAELITVSITPKFATSTLRVRFNAPIASLTAIATMVVALFRDTTANAIAAGSNVILSANVRSQLSLAAEVSAGSTSATTFKIRMGSNGAATMYINGANATRFYGGASRAILIVEEIAA
jgi:hypothetical protein